MKMGKKHVIRASAGGAAVLEQQMERGGVNCPLFQELQTP